MDKFITAICCACLLSVPVGGKEKITLAAVQGKSKPVLRRKPKQAAA